MASSKSSPAPANTAPVVSGVVAGAANSPDFDQWDDVQIGFAPYFHPMKGSFIVAAIIGKDARDPKFVRYQFKALQDTMCRRGPANDDAEEGDVGEDVLVKAGDTFSMSVYYSLSDEFDLHLWASAKSQQPIPVRVECSHKTKTKNDRQVWNFKMKIPKTATALLQPLRDEWRQLKNGDVAARPQLEG